VIVLFRDLKKVHSLFVVVVVVVVVVVFRPEKNVKNKTFLNIEHQHQENKRISFGAFYLSSKKNVTGVKVLASLATCVTNVTIEMSLTSQITEVPLQTSLTSQLNHH
jgi:hypothetical protein